jgi:hypothetical protein
MSITDNVCETPGCKNRGMKYLRNDQFLCRRCARKYDGKADVETEEEKEAREVPVVEDD